jgi:hypothetical protein
MAPGNRALKCASQDFVSAAHDGDLPSATLPTIDFDLAQLPREPEWRALAVRCRQVAIGTHIQAARKTRGVAGFCAHKIPAAGGLVVQVDGFVASRRLAIRFRAHFGAEAQVEREPVRKGCA